MRNYNHAEVTRLLDEMEACVGRVKVLCAQITSGLQSGCFDSGCLESGANEIGYREG